MRLPAGWRLSQHQVDTYAALTQPDGPDVVFNTAMTGDGKSLAGQLPSLVEGWQRPLFAMYPTNELIGINIGKLRRPGDCGVSIPKL